VTPCDGILLLDKPAEITSAQVVRGLSRLTGGLRCGHLGTLDPMATGLLVVLVGNALKLAQYFIKGTKRYVAEVEFGRSTDTWDREGKVVEEGRIPTDLLTRIERAIPAFRGSILQVPPSYSAIKVKGRRLYDLARRGDGVEAPPRTVVIHSLSILKATPHSVLLDVRCGSGTYIRSLAHDLGVAIGCPAMLGSLRRLGSEPFHVDDAVPYESLTAGLSDWYDHLRPMEWKLPPLPMVTMDDDQTRLALHGVTLHIEAPADGPLLLLGPDGRAMAVGMGSAEQLEIRIKRVIRPLAISESPPSQESQ